MTGPILLHDLVRMARGGRQVQLRSAYAGLLVVALFLAFFAWSPRGMSRQAYETGALTLPPGEMPRFAESFFTTFMLVQLVVVVLLTPIYTAGALTEEKERRTLDLLLTTSLSDREIVLGKLVARLAPPALLLLTGLPIVALLQFLGGVDPNLLLTGYVVTLWTMIGVGSFSLLLSVTAGTTWSAILPSYLWAGCALTVALKLVQADWSSNRSTGDILASQLLCQTGFHLPIAAFSSLGAIWMLRSGGQPSRRWRSPRKKKPPKDETRWDRPPVSDNAFQWKEQTDHPFLCDERMIDPAGFLWTFWWLLVPSLVLWGSVAEGTWLPGQAVVCSLGMAWSAVLFLLIALNAAGRFSREIEQRTLDSLRTLPDRDDILLAKWWASVLHVRYGWWFLGWLLLIGLASGMNPEALLLIVLSWWVFAAFLASLGVWFSLMMPSTVWARIATLLVALLLTIYTAAPALTSWLLPLTARRMIARSWLEEILVILVPLSGYGLTAWLLMKSASVRLRALTMGPR